MSYTKYRVGDCNTFTKTEADRNDACKKYNEFDADTQQCGDTFWCAACTQIECTKNGNYNANKNQCCGVEPVNNPDITLSGEIPVLYKPTCHPDYQRGGQACQRDVYKEKCNTMDIMKNNVYCKEWLNTRSSNNGIDDDAMKNYRNILRNYCTIDKLGSDECKDCFTLDGSPCADAIINYCKQNKDTAILSNDMCNKFCVNIDSKPENKKLYKTECDEIIANSCNKVYPQTSSTGQNCDCFYGNDSIIGKTNLEKASISNTLRVYPVTCILPSCNSKGYKTSTMLDGMKGCPDCYKVSSIENNVGAVSNIVQSNSGNCASSDSSSSSSSSSSSDSGKTVTISENAKTEIVSYKIKNVTIVNKMGIKNDIKNSVSSNLYIPVEDVSVIDEDNIDEQNYLNNEYILRIFVDLSKDNNNKKIEENLFKLDTVFIFDYQILSKYSIDSSYISKLQIYMIPSKPFIIDLFMNPIFLVLFVGFLLLVGIYIYSIAKNKTSSKIN